MGLLGTTVAAIVKFTTKVALYSNVNKIVLTNIIAEHKLEVVHSILNVIIVAKTFGLAFKASQTKFTTRLVEP